MPVELYDIYFRFKFVNESKVMTNLPLRYLPQRIIILLIYVC